MKKGSSQATTLVLLVTFCLTHFTFLCRLKLVCGMGYAATAGRCQYVVWQKENVWLITLQFTGISH